MVTVLLEGMVSLERRAAIAILPVREVWDAVGHIPEVLVSDLWGAVQAFSREVEL